MPDLPDLKEAVERVTAELDRGGGDEWCELIYARTRGQARARAAGIEGDDFLNMNARRAPEWDAFAPQGPGEERLFEAGWWFSCCRCSAYARKDDGAACIDGRFYCEDHLPSPAPTASPAAGTDREREAIKNDPTPSKDKGA